MKTKNKKSLFWATVGANEDMEIKDRTTDDEFADKNLIIPSKTKQYMSFQFISKNEYKNKDEKT